MADKKAAAQPVKKSEPKVAAAIKPKTEAVTGTVNFGGGKLIEGEARMCPWTGLVVKGKRVFARFGTDAKVKSWLNRSLAGAATLEELPETANVDRLQAALTKAVNEGVTKIDKPSLWVGV